MRKEHKNPKGGLTAKGRANFKRKEGGLKDIRQSVRPDLMPAPTFTGFDLGVRSAAKGGLQELDMRMGGPSIGPGTGTSDDIPAMLSDGEFVMTSAAVRGLGALNGADKGDKIEQRRKGAKVMQGMMKNLEKRAVA